MLKDAAKTRTGNGVRRRFSRVHWIGTTVALFGVLGGPLSEPWPRTGHAPSTVLLCLAHCGPKVPRVGRGPPEVERIHVEMLKVSCVQNSGPDSGARLFTLCRPLQVVQEAALEKLKQPQTAYST